jgi:hypothetical protein
MKKTRSKKSRDTVPLSVTALYQRARIPLEIVWTLAGNVYDIIVRFTRFLDQIVLYGLVSLV